MASLRMTKAGAGSAARRNGRPPQASADESRGFRDDDDPCQAGARLFHALLDELGQPGRPIERLRLETDHLRKWTGT